MTTIPPDLSDASAGDVPTCSCLLCSAAGWSAAPIAAGLDPQGSLPQGAPSSTVSALLATGTPRWGSGGVGSGATVTYSFMEQAPSYASTSDGTGFAPLSATQRDAVRQAFAAWSAVANIFFVETSDSANSGQGGSIRIGTNRQSSSAAYAYYPTGSLYDGGGDIYLANNTSTNSSPTPGTYGYLTILHEIGHAIGLKHPGNYNATGGGGEPPYLSSAEDNYRYTIMSYNRHPSLGLSGLATGPALYDIAAAQYLYGANTGTRIGDDRYAFGSNTTPFSQAIWDAVRDGLLVVHESQRSAHFLVNAEVEPDLRTQLMQLPVPESSEIYRIAEDWAAASMSRKKAARPATSPSLMRRAKLA